MTAVAFGSALLLQLKLKDKVSLLDPKDASHRVAIGEVSGLHESGDLFHHQPIPKGWLKVNVLEVIDPKFPLMRPHEPADQYLIGDTKNGLTLWKQVSVTKCPKK